MKKYSLFLYNAFKVNRVFVTIVTTETLFGCLILFSLKKLKIKWNGLFKINIK